VAFSGMGEKIEDLELYDSKKFVGRLLGFADLESLLEKVKTVAEEEQLSPDTLTEKFTIKTFFEQLRAAKKLGPLQNVFSMLGAPDVPRQMLEQSEEKLKKYESMVNSMTKEEREDASLFHKGKGRIARIAKGAGVSELDVRDFLKQFEQVEKLFTGFKKNRGLRRKIERMVKGGGLPQNMAGGLT